MGKCSRLRHVRPLAYAGELLARRLRRSELGYSELLSLLLPVRGNSCVCLDCIGALSLSLFSVVQISMQSLAEPKKKKKIHISCRAISGTTPGFELEMSWIRKLFVFTLAADSFSS